MFILLLMRANKCLEGAMIVLQDDGSYLGANYYLMHGCLKPLWFCYSLDLCNVLYGP